MNLSCFILLNKQILFLRPLFRNLALSWEILVGTSVNGSSNIRDRLRERKVIFELEVLSFVFLFFGENNKVLLIEVID
jgi:hypothetical protein